MRKILGILSWLFLLAENPFTVSGQDLQIQYTEASSLTILGKVFPDTSNPYERMDFNLYDGWDKKDKDLLEMPTGIIISFRTNAPAIYVKPVFKSLSKFLWSGYGARGFDLYIKKDGFWLWAGDCVYGLNPEEESNKEKKLVENMATGEKECLLYLPTYSKVSSVGIGVPKGYSIEKGGNPFRYRICIYGSSFVHGACTSRSGQTLPAFLCRSTGFEFCSLGVSGHCKMQPQYAHALKEADVDAFVIDAFSNASEKIIEENIFSFIETIQSTKPEVPIIFIGTIRMERRNFNRECEENDSRKIEAVKQLMAKVVKQYKDVYYVPSNAADANHDTTVDGVHPSDWGYHIWAESIRQPLLRILKKYGVR